MYFVLTTGRSGSKTVAHLLSLIGGCTCLHEPAPELIHESSAYRYGDLQAECVEQILLETRPAHHDGCVYCESNQTLSLIVPVLAEVFPEARYIWLLRNGLDMVASAYSKQWYSGHSENHDRYEDCTPLERAWIDGRIEGDRCGDMSTEEWQGLDRFGRCCWYWTYVNNLIEADLQRLAPGRYRLLHLERIDDELLELVRWMGLRVALVPASKQLNAGKRAPHPWTSWDAAERSTFEHWCGELMDRLYPDWRTTDGDWVGVPYRSRSGVFSQLGRTYRLVKPVNRWLAPNRVL